MTAEIKIRPVEADDLDAVTALLEREAAHNSHDFDGDSPYHPVNAAIAIVSASLDRDGPDCGWLAFSDGKPAGIITTPQGLAGGVFVADRFRGQGIAQSLIREREGYFKDVLGLTEIQRPVRADNEASIRLHTEKLGYHFSQASLNLLKETPSLPGHTVLYLAKTL